MDTLPNIEETSIDGVQTFWIDAGAPFTATLMFRAGMGDERLVEHGITHLVEHLALAPLRHEPVQFNATVEMDVTTFWATGSVASVADFMGRLTANLSDLDLGRLDIEANVLIAESLQRGTSSFATILASRYGPHGPGVLEYPEYGLRRASGNDVRQWAADRFTADNAVLAITGPPPDELRLTLPRGDRHTFVPPDVRPLYRSRGRVRVGSQTHGAAIGAFGSRSYAMHTAALAVAHGLQERLRHGLGYVYTVLHDHLRLTADEVYYFWGVDCDAPHIREVTEGFGVVINKMVDRGPTDGDLQRIRATFDQVEEFDPMSIGRDLVQRRAKDELRGHPNQDLREMLAEIRALTPADLGAALADAMGDAMAIIADGMEIGFHDPTFGWDRSVAGKTIRFSRGDDDYVLGSEGVSVVTSYDCTTILFDGLLVVEHVAPDQRLLIDERGSWIMVGPARRRSHRRFIDALDERVPQDVVVPERR